MTSIGISWRSRQLARWIKHRFTSSALILMYHRISELPNDPHLLAVSLKHFADQLEIIRKFYSPIRLGELSEALQAGEVPDRAIVITFDDGYADNLYYAKPILESYEIPATVFVTAGQTGSRREFWWDELDRLLLQPGSLPGKLRLNLNGDVYEWELGEAATYTEETYQRDRDWHIERPEEPSTRHQLFRWLYDRLHELPHRERSKVLGELLNWSGAEPTARVSHQALSTDEILFLVEGGLIEVGAHTMTHPNLCTLSEEEQRDEIRQSKDFLEAIVERPVTTFAYPYGSSTPRIAATIRELGFACACSSDPNNIWRSADRFQLPRVVVRDWDGETFDRWLRWWMGA